MFNWYLCYYDGRFVAKLAAMHENSAIEKCGQLIGLGASAYSGNSRRLITVVKL